MFRLAPLILRNVLRNRRRSLLTLASTAISLTLLALMVAAYQAFFHGADVSSSEARRIVTRHRVSLTQALPASYEQQISRVPGVQFISQWSWFQGVYINSSDFFGRFAVDPDTIFSIHADWDMPAQELSAFQHERTACAVSKQIADQYKIHVGDPLTIVGDIYPVTLELKVAGIFTCPTAASCLVFRNDYLQELLPKDSPQRDTVGTYSILVDSPESAPRVAHAIDAMYDNSPFPTRTESEKEFGRSFLAFLGNIKLFLAAIFSAVTFTILLVSANTVAMAVRERTRETAILRTLGYDPFEILMLILGEAVWISLIGGAIGIGLGWVMGRVLEAQIAAFGFQSLKWQGALVVLGVAAVVGFIAALVPAVVASRKNIVESLRFAG